MVLSLWSAVCAFGMGIEALRELFSALNLGDDARERRELNTFPFLQRASQAGGRTGLYWLAVFCGSLWRCKFLSSCFGGRSEGATLWYVSATS